MNKILTTNYLLLTTILIIAVFLRLYNITETPPGFYPDEAIYANNGVEAWGAAPPAGGFKVFYPENNGREGLWPNIIGFFVIKFGHEPWVPRSVAAVFGTLTVLGVYFLTKELLHQNPKLQAPNYKQISNSNNQNQKRFGILNFKNWKLFGIWNLEFGISHSQKIALLSSFFLATSFWHILFSRIGFRAIMAPFFLTWGIYFLLKSLNANRYTLYAIAGGIFYGLGFHTYIAYRATPLLVLVIIVLYWFQSKSKKEKSILMTSDVQNIDGNLGTSEVQKLARKKILLSTFYFLLATIIVAAPLGIYFLENPQDFFGRTTQISVFNSPTPLKDLGMSIIKTAGMFNFVGDFNWRHNYSGRPQLFWPVGILFLIGLGVLIRRLFLPSIILFSWLIITALPVVISNEGLPHALRAILMAPAVFILAGVGGVWLMSRIMNYELGIRSNGSQNSKILKFIIHASLFIILLLFALEAYTTYFILWAKNPNTAGAFSADYVKISRELNSLPKELPKYVVVEAGGVDVRVLDPFDPTGRTRGIPMPAQTVMFITDTFTTEKQKEKNIYYVLPKEIDKIPENSYIILLK